VRRQAANISRTEWPMKKQLAIAAIIIPVPLRIRGWNWRWRSQPETLGEPPQLR